MKTHANSNDSSPQMEATMEIEWHLPDEFYNFHCQALDYTIQHTEIKEIEAIDPSELGSTRIVKQEKPLILRGIFPTEEKYRERKLMTEERKPQRILLRTKEASKRIGLSVTTLNKRRWEGKPPRFLKLGSLVYYDQNDLDDYLDSCVRESTSQIGEKK